MLLIPSFQINYKAKQRIKMEHIISDFFLWKIDQNKLKDYFENSNSVSHQLKLIDKTISSKGKD